MNKMQHQEIIIKKIVRESPKVLTLFFNLKIEYEPGQFVMLWIPGLDEKPFAVSYFKKNEIGITIECKGEFTKKICTLKVGDKLYLRGPFGNGFVIKKNACIAAGGVGLAPLSPLIEKLRNPTVIYGVKTKNDLIFKNKLKNFSLSSDDGSVGFHGFTPQLLEKILQGKKFDAVYTAGPEIMMKKIFDICEKNKIECQASLERFMFCGMGICGSCTCDGFLVCKDGPVFSSKQLRQMEDFGKYAKLKSGEKVTLKEYYDWRG